MDMEIVGLVIVLTHFIVIGSIVLWFGLGKPTSWGKFTTEFKRQFFGVGSHTR